LSRLRFLCLIWRHCWQTRCIKIWNSINIKIFRFNWLICSSWRDKFLWLCDV